MREESIRLILQKLGITDTHRSRDWVQASCPFAPYKHQTGMDRNASFGVKINDRGSSHYTCFSCKSSGPLHTLPVNLRKMDASYPDPKELMHEIIMVEAGNGFGLFEDNQGGDEWPEHLNEAVYGDLYGSAWDNEGGRAYLRYRGISEEACRKNDIGFDPEEARVMWPVRDRLGLLYGWTGRTILDPDDWPDLRSYEKSRDYSGLRKKFLLLNVNNWERGMRVVVVEGPMDMSRLQTIITPEQNICPVAIMGSELTPPKIDTLIEMGAPTYLLFDNDTAGEIGIFGTEDNPEKGALHKLGKELPLYIPNYPEDVADPADLTAQQWDEMLTQTPIANL